MSNKKLRILTYLVVVLASLPVFARDFQYTYEGQTLTYTVISEEEGTCKTKDGKVGITGEYTPGNYVSGSLIIPAIVNDGSRDFQVTELGIKGFTDCDYLTSVIIPNSVTSIGTKAFDKCRGLIKSTYPSTLGNPFPTGITIAYDPNGAIYENGWIYGPNKSEIRFAPYNLEGSYRIPETVTSIGLGAFAGCSGLKSVIIPNSVTSIGASAFYKCSGLTEVTIPNSVITISNYAFRGCNGLTSVIIPNSVTIIGSEVFADCRSLIKSAYPNIFENPFPSGIGISYNPNSAIIEDGWVYGPGKTQIYFAPCSLRGSYRIPETVTSIGDYAFSSCKDLTEVSIPNSVTSIGKSAFSYCSGLTSVNIPSSVKSIGGSAFQECYGLTKAEFESIESLCSIEFGDSYSNPLDYARYLFINGKKIKELDIPSSVKAIGNYAFCGCRDLTSVNIPNSVTSIGHDAFYGCLDLKSVIIPESVTSIGDYTFHNCIRLTSVIIPNSVTEIGEHAFAYCRGLTSVSIGNAVKSIGSQAFQGCDELTSVTIGNSVKSIGDGAFAYCSGLKSVIIPNSVTSIGDDAFSGCTGLPSVIIPTSVTSIGTKAFNECSKLIKSAYPNTLENPFPSGICIGYNPEGAIIEDGWIYGPQKSEIRFAPYTLEGDYHLPESVTSIDNGAFWGCSGLTEVSMKESVKRIEENTFRDCSGLSSVTIPNSVTSIGNRAFAGCSELTEVNIPNSVTTIGNSTFSDCNTLASLSLGASLSTIGEKAFDNCSALKTIYSYNITPPALGSNAFNGVSNDAVVYIPKGRTLAYSNRWKKFWDYREMGTDVISLDKTTISLVVGEKTTITSTIQSDDIPGIAQESWTSSNLSVATVDNGVVTAVGKGYATIRFSITDVNGVYYTATCEVQVTEKSDVNEVYDVNDAQPEIYTLQGNRVNCDGQLTPGIYIVRKGNKTTKIVVK